MRLGRNLARTFLDYYRFTNVLPISPPRELATKKLRRPKTHRPRGKSTGREQQLLPRPKTTRVNAPISYKDLSKCYDSDSNEGAASAYMGYGFGRRTAGNLYINQDQYSLCNIKTAKFSALDFSGGGKPIEKEKLLLMRNVNHSKVATECHVQVPPKPYLTIIDFNQLTRGGLERAKGKSFDSAEKALKQLSPKKSKKAFC